MKKIIRISAMFCILCAMLSCESNSISPALSRDYFVLSEGTELEYYKEGISTGDQTQVWLEDTIQFIVQGDTLIDNISYRRVMNNFGAIEKVVRKNGSQYFGRNHEFYGGFSKEYMFLDTSLPVQGSWEYIKEEGHAITEYLVKEIHNTYTIRDVQYQRVIELEVNYYNDYADGKKLDLHYSAKHFYAPGVGEIYAYYPSPVSGRYYDTQYSLLSSQIK